MRKPHSQPFWPGSDSKVAGAAFGGMGITTSEFDHRVRTASHCAILLTLGILALLHLRAVIEPFIIAVFIFFLLAPGAHWLNGRGVPLFPAYAAVVGALAALIGGAGWWLYQDVSTFADTLPDHVEKVQDLMAQYEGREIFGITLTFVGLESAVTDVAAESLLLSIFGEVGSFLTLTFTVFVFLVFIILEAETLPKRLAAAYPAEFNTQLGEMVVDIGKGVNRYVVVKTVVSFGTASVTGLLLLITGVPGWFLWAALTFLLNYVPYIGSLFALIPPAILALLTLEPVTALILIGVLITNQQVWGQFIENKMFGASLDISPVVLLLVTAFWFWLWGIMGMVLAVPMAVIAKIVLGNIPETRPISILLSERPPAVEEE